MSFEINKYCPSFVAIITQNKWLSRNFYCWSNLTKIVVQPVKNNASFRTHIHHCWRHCALYRLSNRRELLPAFFTDTYDIKLWRGGENSQYYTTLKCSDHGDRSTTVTSSVFVCFVVEVRCFISAMTMICLLPAYLPRQQIWQFISGIVVCYFLA